MQPSAKVPVSRDAMIQFAKLKKAQEMVLWNKKYTPWVFDLCKDAEEQLYESYQQQINGQEKPQTLTKQILQQMTQQPPQ